MAVGNAPPPPKPGDLLAADTFERTVASGWGAATLGGTWSLTGTTTAYGVSGGAGHINPPIGVTREARLAINAADVNIAGQVAFDQLPSAGNAFAYVVARADATNAYGVTIRVISTGAVIVKLTKLVANVQSDLAAQVTTSVIATAGGSMSFRFQIVGGHLQFRIWNSAGVEPSTWITQADDASIIAPGSVGLRALTGASVPSGPVPVSFDNFEVRVP